MHKLVDKKFSVDYPYSEYTAAVFETRNTVVDSFIAENEEGLWDEFMVSKYTEE